MTCAFYKHAFHLYFRSQTSRYNIHNMHIAQFILSNVSKCMLMVIMCWSNPWSVSSRTYLSFYKNIYIRYIYIFDISFVWANLPQLRIWNPMTVVINISKQIKSVILIRQINFLTFMNYDYVKYHESLSAND